MPKRNNIDDLLCVFEELDKLNPEAKMLSESTLSTCDVWVDTGCGALNAIISGDIVNGGVPAARITTFSGESQSGKSYLINRILANGQKDHGMLPVIFDSEFDKDKNMAEAAGLDPKRTKYVPIGSIEDLTLQMCKFLDSVVANNKQGKYIVAVDSLGNLASEKEIKDIDKDKTTGDQGLRAKEIKKFFRLVTYKCARAKVPMIISNHIYHNPQELYPSLVKKAGGGTGPEYMASVGIQMAARKEKIEEGDNSNPLPESKSYAGVTLRMLTVKNRFVPPFLAIENYLSFTSGLDRYSGLVEMAENHGVIVKDGHRYKLYNDEKLGFLKDWKDDATIWNTKIIPELNERLKKAYRYNSAIKDEVQPEPVEAEQADE